MTTACKNWQERLLSYHDDPSCEEAAAVRKHVAECQACAAELKRLQGLDDLLKRRAVPEADEDNLHETVDQVRAKLKARPRVVFLRWWIGAAAAAAVLLLAGWYHLALRGERESTDGPEAPGPDAEFVERLVQANLAVAEANTPGERAKIFSHMAEVLCDHLVGAVASDDGEGAEFAAENFQKLVKDGVMANARLLTPTKDKQVLLALQSALTEYSAKASAVAEKCDGEVRKSIDRTIEVVRSARADTERILRGA